MSPSSSPHTVLKDTLSSILAARDASANLGTLIQDYRREQNMSQRFLATKLGITSAFLSDIENNHRSMSPETIKRFLELL
jgi:predicted transcriptional regulator